MLDVDEKTMIKMIQCVTNRMMVLASQNEDAMDFKSLVRGRNIQYNQERT